MTDEASFKGKCPTCKQEVTLFLANPLWPWKSMSVEVGPEEGALSGKAYFVKVQGRRGFSDFLGPRKATRMEAIMAFNEGLTHVHT